MSDNHPPPPDALDAAAAALRDAGVPPGPPDSLVADTLAAIDTRRAARPSPQRRRWIMRIIGVGTLTTAAAVVAALFAFPARSAADDLKKAVEKAEQAKTVRVQIETDFGRDSKMIVTSHIDGDKLRTEFQPRGLVVVVNKKEDLKGLMLITKMKTYRELDADKDPLVNQVRGDVKRALEQFKGPADDQVKALPDEDLDGRKTKVFEIKDADLPEGKGKADLKMWVDAKTGLPAQSLVTSKVDGRTVITTAKYLGFNEEFDAKLFETKIPDGYTKR
jgi:outer membrane lipoprotein-sorting protein